MKKILFVILMLVNSKSLYSQYNFQHLIGGPDHERAQTIFSTYDNCYIVNGASFSFGSGYVDIVYIKTDSAGQTIWSYAYGSSGFDDAEYAFQSSDKGIVGAGLSSFTPGGLTSAVIFKTDSAGALVWTKSFGGIANDGLVRVIETLDHGFAAVGNSNSVSSGLNDILFIKVDDNGDTMFTHSYGTAEDETGTSVIQLPDSGYLITGKQIKTFSGIPVADGLLLRTDASGNLMWSKIYGDSLWEEFNALKQTPDSSFIICGANASSGAGGFDILLLKTDTAGSVLWSKAYGGVRSDAAYDIHVIDDNAYVLSGYTESLGYGHVRGEDSTNIFLMKTDLSGTLLWMETYGDGLQDEAYRCNVANDGGFLVSGFTTDFLLSDSTQMYFIKTDSMGLSGCHEESANPSDTFATIPFSNILLNQLNGINYSTINYIRLIVSPTNDDACLYYAVPALTSKEKGIKVFPNPFHDSFDLNVENVQPGSAVIITDIFGRSVEMKFKEDGKIQMSDFPSGIYIVSVVDSNNKVFHTRVVKQ